jgi:hypothetical protein
LSLLHPALLRKLQNREHSGIFQVSLKICAVLGVALSIGVATVEEQSTESNNKKKNQEDYDSFARYRIDG